MRIAVLCTGKLKEAYLRDAADEYKKRLSRYAELEIIETPDEPVPERYSEAQRVQAMQKEGERMLREVGPRDFVAALAITGKRHTSESFAKSMEAWMAGGFTRIVFIIGGSLGLSPQVLARADAQLSLSDLTFPHQLARVVLLEQVYRAFRIINNEPYHK